MVRLVVSQARACFDTVNPSMADHVDAVETRVIPLSTLGDVAVENARKMFYALTMLLQGPPLLLLKRMERGNRFEAWRQLVERYEGQCESTASHVAIHHASKGIPIGPWGIRGGP